ncbi:MAG: ribbon-helix-helix domain-containing protein [Actinobacteria bacterium]|nr:ribbon-helix-helix domain-containing protein [Actinomycetota bacterium]
MAGDTTLPPVRVETDFKERLVRYSEQQERSVSWVIKKAITEYLDRHEDEEHGPASRKEATG